MQITIYFTVSTEYRWEGELTDLPAAVRKGVTKREGGETVLDEEALSEKLDDELLEKLAKKSEIDNQSYDISMVEGE